MVNYLSNYEGVYANRAEVKGLDGYWTDSCFDTTQSAFAHAVIYVGLSSGNYLFDSSVGVRPVINLSI